MLRISSTLGQRLEQSLNQIVVGEETSVDVISFGPDSQEFYRTVERRVGRQLVRGEVELLDDS